MEELITPSEVAAILRIHVQTVYKLAEKGAIPGSKIGRSWRFRKSNILDLVPGNEEEELRGADLAGRKRRGHKKSG